jgi:ketosteroid isomerase-like protein
MTDPRIQLVTDVFAAWSSGDASAPERYFHPDAELIDIVGGTHRGWPAIHAFFAKALVRWPDLVLAPEEFWVNDTGVAVRWTMSATVIDDTFGPGYAGKRWQSFGMSHLVIDDGRVRREVDYHDRGAALASLQGRDPYPAG